MYLLVMLSINELQVRDFIILLAHKLERNGLIEKLLPTILHKLYFSHIS